MGHLKGILMLMKILQIEVCFFIELLTRYYEPSSEYDTNYTSKYSAQFNNAMSLYFTPNYAKLQ